MNTTASNFIRSIQSGCMLLNVTLHTLQPVRCCESAQVIFSAVLLLILLCCVRTQRHVGYDRVAVQGGESLRVCFELGNELREYSVLSLEGITSVVQLRERLLILASELLIDPEDDLGGGLTLRYSDARSGKLHPCDSQDSVEMLRRGVAAELRVTAVQLPNDG